MKKLNCKQERWLVCGFVASLHVLIFAVVGHNTINIPEIFHGFPGCTVTFNLSNRRLIAGINPR